MLSRRHLAAALIPLWLLSPMQEIEPIRIVVCHPGSPGTTEQAKKTMQAFARCIEIDGGLPEGTIRCVFFPEAEQALDYIRKENPPLGIVSLSFYLRYREKLQLDPFLQVVRRGKSTQTFHILAKKGRHPNLESLEGVKIVSNHLFDPAFLHRVILGGKGKHALQVEETRKPLRAIRKTAREGEAAVLLDDEQLETLGKMKGLLDELEEIFRSEKLPTEPVVAMGPERKDPSIAKARAALERLSETKRGAEICAEFRIDRLVAPDPKAFAEAVRLYGQEAK